MYTLAQLCEQYEASEREEIELYGLDVDEYVTNYDDVPSIYNDQEEFEMSHISLDEMLENDLERELDQEVDMRGYEYASYRLQTENRCRAVDKVARKRWSY